MVLNLSIVLRLEVIWHLQVAVRVLVEPQLGQGLVLVRESGDAVDLVDLGRGTSAVAHGTVAGDEVLVDVAIVAQEHALADLVDASVDGSTFSIQQRTIKATLSKQDAGIGTVQVVVVKILHHEEGPPLLLLRWQQQLVVHGKRAVVERGRQEVGAEIVAGVVQVGSHQPMESPFAPSLLLRAVLVPCHVPQILICK